MDPVKFKVLSVEDRFIGLDTTKSSAQYAYGDGTDGSDQPLTWYLIDRDVSAWNTDDLKHLFMTLGLARERDLDENDLIEIFGAIDWYNAKTMLIASLPQSGCGTYIDGNTVALRVPTGLTEGDYVEFYGTSFAGRYDSRTKYDVAVPYDNSVYGGASSYLMSNGSGPHSYGISADRYSNRPYTGTIDQVVNPNAGLASWTGSNVDNKTFFPHLRAVHVSRDPDDGWDLVQGVALLEKGLFVIFDDRYAISEGRDFLGDVITGNTAMWTANTAGQFVAMTVSGGTVEQNNSDLATNRRAIQFTGSAANVNARVFYRTVTEEYKFVYFCHASQNEFNSTSNHTYDHRKAYFQPDEADDIYITEVALVDDNDVVMAYGKLSEPVQKNSLETLTLKVEINIGVD